MIRGLLRTTDACRTAFEIASRSAFPPKHAAALDGKSKAPLPDLADEVVKSVEQAKPASSVVPNLRKSEGVAKDDAPPLPTQTIQNENERSAERRGQRSLDELPASASLATSETQSLHSSLEAATQPIAQMRSSTVPTSRFGRLLQYGGLAMGVGLGTAQAALSSKKYGSSPIYFSESNIRRIVNTLSRMRGAALKVGQFLSIQDSKMLPPEVVEILSRVQNAADYMPWWQTEKLLTEEWGREWRYKFAQFDESPIAAASIGQVHQATLHDGSRVAVKIQFPGIAQSINADIGYLKSLLTMSFILPRGLFLENSLKVLSQELHEECDYLREAHACEHFKWLLRDDSAFAVPLVHRDMTTRRVLTMDLMRGVSLRSLKDASQSLRDHIGSLVVKLCLKEMFQFRFMQTDPNWSNFLWNQQLAQLEIIDFGASRTYSNDFSGLYKGMLLAAIADDRIECEKISRQLGFLIESDVPEMVNAHIDSVMALSEPFKVTTYDFGKETITSRIRSQIPVMLQHRQTPPPNETYSLNRKLSGCFLLCANLNSRVNCAELLSEVA